MNIFKPRHSSFFLSETYYMIVSNLSVLLKGPSNFQNRQETRPAPYKGFCAIEVRSPIIKNNQKLMTFSLSKNHPQDRLTGKMHFENTPLLPICNAYYASLNEVLCILCDLKFAGEKTNVFLAHQPITLLIKMKYIFSV